MALRHFGSYLRFVGFAVAGLALDLWSKEWAFHTLRQGGRRILIPHLLEFQTMLNKGALFGIGGGQTVLFLVASAFALILVFWMFSQTSPRRWALQIALGAILAGALGNMYDRVFVKLVDRGLPSGGRLVYVVRSGQDAHGTILTEYPPRAGAAEFRMRPGPNPDGGVVISEYPRGSALRLEEAPGEVGFVRDFVKIPTTLPQWRWIPEKLRGKELWPWVFNVADMLLVGGVGILALHLWRDRKRPPQRAPIAVDSPAGTT